MTESSKGRDGPGVAAKSNDPGASGSATQGAPFSPPATDEEIAAWKDFFRSKWPERHRNEKARVDAKEASQKLQALGGATSGDRRGNGDEESKIAHRRALSPRQVGTSERVFIGDSEPVYRVTGVGGNPRGTAWIEEGEFKQLIRADGSINEEMSRANFAILHEFQPEPLDRVHVLHVRPGERIEADRSDVRPRAEHRWDRAGNGVVEGPRYRGRHKQLEITDSAFADVPVRSTGDARSYPPEWGSKGSEKAEIHTYQPGADLKQYWERRQVDIRKARERESRLLVTAPQEESQALEARGERQRQEQRRGEERRRQEKELALRARLDQGRREKERERERRLHEQRKREEAEKKRRAEQRDKGRRIGDR